MAPVCLVLALLLTLSASACAAEKPMKTTAVTIAGKAFTLELAVDEPTRRRGMGGRTGVAEDGGMLFVFRRPGPQTFWMKDCLIGLDIIFLDAGGRVLKICTLPPPPPGASDDDIPRCGTAYDCQFVIELKPGTSEKLGLKEGDKVDMPLDRLKKLAR